MNARRTLRQQFWIARTGTVEQHRRGLDQRLRHRDVQLNVAERASSRECQSCAHWLMWQCGESLRTAQDKVRVAHALAALPAIRAEFAAGRLSYSKVRAITRVADDRTIPQPGDDPLHARQADALVAICAGTADPSPATVVVHVDADTLNHDADGACHLDNSANLAPETARRLACDATSHDVIERDGEPIATTKAASSLPPRLRRDLAARDRGCCRIPGCGRTGRVHAHHIIHRAHHGPNTLENLLTLCPFHHRLVHEAGYRVEVLLDQVIVHRPGRPPLTESNPPPPTGPDVPARNELRQLHIDPDTIVCDWDGSPLRHDDLSFTIAVLNSGDPYT